MQPLDPETKVPVGDPRASYHFHNTRLTPWRGEGFRLSVGGDRVVFNLEEMRGNVWLTNPQSEAP